MKVSTMMATNKNLEKTNLEELNIQDNLQKKIDELKENIKDLNVIITDQ